VEEGKRERGGEAILADKANHDQRIVPDTQSQTNSKGGEKKNRTQTTDIRHLSPHETALSEEGSGGGVRLLVKISLNEDRTTISRKCLVEMKSYYRGLYSRRKIYRLGGIWGHIHDRNAG
jgi:hypothetical protein